MDFLWVSLGDYRVWFVFGKTFISQLKGCWIGPISDRVNDGNIDWCSVDIFFFLSMTINLSAFLTPSLGTKFSMVSPFLASTSSSL